MSLPALRALRRRFPAAHISILAMPGIVGLYARETWANEVLLLEGARGARDWRRKWKQARELGRRRFDAALLLTNSFESAALFAAARIPVRVGYARDGRTPLLTQAVPPPQRGEIPRHESYYYLELLKRAGWLAEGGWPPEDGMVIRLEGIEAARAAGRTRFDAEFGTAGRAVIGVSPGAAYGTAKRWLPERFAEAARLLAARLGNAAVAVFGTPDERELCEQVAAMAGGVSFAGRTKLAEYIDLAAACTAFLTNDSGSMHIASALGVPTVAVFGATDHIGTGPTGPLARVVRRAVDCSPHPHPCLLRNCPIDHRCMKAVTAAEVAEQAEMLVQLSR
ncbi:MAG: lipopolysaccharide heptosyltransferase II [Bryobacterales bacterium]|nr:lipopolysaccharide heptosyltransferase II [Bryobacterales bacterium]